MNNQNKNLTKPREGWAEMIRQEVEDSGHSEILIPDFFDEDNSDWTW
ncbi:hypothetical protein [Flavobacterium rivuli]|nr:hypothetical protein [Flavobacterium rivuli]